MLKNIKFILLNDVNVNVKIITETKNGVVESI